MKKFFAPLLIGAALAAATPSFGQGLDHTFFMRGQIVAMDPTGAVICIGRADGAKTGQVLDVYRLEYRHVHRSEAPTYKRVKVGSVTITEVVDDHFARVRLTDGAISSNDMVELRKD